jgi:IS4 transposase
VPSIASTDYRMRFFTFVFSCLLYNMWRVVDHSLKTLATEAYDEYGRGKHEERLDPLLPLADLLASTLVLCLGREWDPPDTDD